MTRESTLNPFDIEDARQAVKVAGRIQEQVEHDLRDASRALAEAERVYREGLASTILRLKAEGVAWTVCGDLARGEPSVSRLRVERDVQAGLLEAVHQSAFRRGSDRKDLTRILDWSARRDLADDHQGQREPDVAWPAFGAVRAT